MAEAAVNGASIIGMSKRIERSSCPERHLQSQPKAARHEFRRPYARYIIIHKSFAYFIVARSHHNLGRFKHDSCLVFQDPWQFVDERIRNGKLALEFQGPVDFRLKKEPRDETRLIFAMSFPISTDSKSPAPQKPVSKDSDSAPLSKLKLCLTCSCCAASRTLSEDF